MNHPHLIYVSYIEMGFVDLDGFQLNLELQLDMFQNQKNKLDILFHLRIPLFFLYLHILLSHLNNNLFVFFEYLLIYNYYLINH